MKQTVMITEQGDLGLGANLISNSDKKKADRAAMARKQADAKKIKREQPKK